MDNETILIIVTIALAVLCLVLEANNISTRNKLKSLESKIRHDNVVKANEIRMYIPKFVGKLLVAESLMEVFHIHQLIWGAGIRPYNIGPDRYGMYRTEDILTMQPREVYLGNIYGLNTLAIPEWEKVKNSDQDSYQKVLNQYRGQLISNLKVYEP